MNSELTTDALIDELVANAAARDATPRERHLYREALRSLVRLAKVEQMNELRRNVAMLAPLTPSLQNVN